jgi:N-acyl-D-aspartate/D-glutamate deacylase
MTSLSVHLAQCTNRRLCFARHSMGREMQKIRCGAAWLATVFILGGCTQAGTGSTSSPTDLSGPFDVIIANGQVVDGTGNPWYYADVAIRGDRIVAVAAPHALDSAKATRRIDASGLVVTPGFIDMQGQSADAFVNGDGRAISKITQGVTSEILGEGDTPAPANDKLLAFSSPENSTDTAMTHAMRGFTGEHGFGAWLDAMEHHGVSVNVGSYLGAETVRIYAMGSAPGAPSAAQLDTMRRVVRDAMRDGAFGVASALIYPPGSYAGTAELTEMARAMAPLHGTYITHMRSEDDSLLEATDEAMRIGRDGGVPVILYHLKAAGPRNWSKEPALLAKIDSARAAGQDVTATMYPYPASSNGLASCVPPYVSANGKLLENLRDSTKRTRIEREMADASLGVTADCQGIAPDQIMVVGFEQPQFKQYEGKRLSEIAKSMGTTWQHAVVEILLAGDTPGRVTFSMNEANVAMEMQKPWMMFGTDAEAWNPADSLKGLTHPRAYGSFPRILGRYVREQKLLTLEDAVRKMTSLPADRLGLRERGQLRTGFFADVVVLDPNTVIDRATYDRPHQLSAGIQDVFVNGTAVVSNGAVTNAKPGKALRGAGWNQ